MVAAFAVRQGGEKRLLVVLLKAGERKPAALALLAYLRTAPARALIVSYGYGL